MPASKNEQVDSYKGDGHIQLHMEVMATNSY